ncbi:hypothetical protein M0R72_13590 [Candidatus Pacearchaeota archaeon]|jgi:hypothetical protein|nr:hypothetical protein [Candidatus Pacearchaeota archaeon]
MSSTREEQAVIEAAKLWEVWTRQGDESHKGEHPETRLHNAIRALDHAPDAGQMVRCGNRGSYNTFGCIEGGCRWNKKHKTSAEPRYACYRPEPVPAEPAEPGIFRTWASERERVAEWEAMTRRRELEAFVAGVHECWTGDSWTPIRKESAVERASSRYPDPTPTDATREDPALDNPTLEDRVAELERKEKSHWARMNDMDRRIDELERITLHLPTYRSELGGLANGVKTLTRAYDNLSSIMADEIKDRIAKQGDDGK